MSRPNNRQMSRDWRTVDVSGGDYTSEKEGGFIFRVGTGGAVAIRNVVTGATELIENIQDGERIECVTDTIYQAGTTATEIHAIY